MNSNSQKLEKLNIGGSGIRSDLDDESGKDIIRVMDMRVALHDEGVAALVADGVEGLTFSDDINFVAGTVHLQELFTSEGVIFCGGIRALSYRSQKD